MTVGRVLRTMISKDALEFAELLFRIVDLGAGPLSIRLLLYEYPERKSGGLRTALLMD